MCVQSDFRIRGIILISGLRFKKTKQIEIVAPSMCWSQLSSRASLTQAVQLIGLKSGRMRAGGQCLTAGWGDVGDNGTSPERLQEVNVTVLPQRTCSRRWRGTQNTEA